MRTLFLSLLLALVLVSAAQATPSTMYWTPASIDIQPPGTAHLTLDNYFTVGRSSGEDFPTDFGLTWGFRLSDAVNAEVGFDIFEPTDDPLFFNAKIGIEEGAWAPGAPGLALGIYNIGTESGLTDQNIVYLVVGKTLPDNLGRLHIGGYWGNDDLLVDADGNEENSGWMIGWDKEIIPGSITLLADYASGDNAVGGYGAGLSFAFGESASLIVGPVWFNEEAINGDSKWTTQLDINF